MFASERFLKRLSRTRKEHRESAPEDLEPMIRSAFTMLLDSLPAGMADAVFDQFWDAVVRRSDGERPLVDDARYLADVVDLFSGQYDVDHDPLHPNDWALVGDLVNDYAVEMDMGTVTEIMSLVVDHDGV